MAIIVFDDFNRADNPTSLGTANTGQTWSQFSGVSGSFSISSNAALWTWHVGDPGSRALIETGFVDAITTVTLPNATSGPNGFAAGEGIICRWQDSTHYWRMLYYKLPGALLTIRLQRVFGGLGTTVFEYNVTLADNDTIGLGYCGTHFDVYVNGSVVGTYDDTGGTQYGTICGLVGSSGTYFSTILKTFDDFTVETNGTCTATYNCTGGACVDPGDGTGTYATLAACLEGCTVAASYNCTGGQCVDPGDGSGTYATLAACVASGCGGGTVVVETMRFDAGTGNSYYYVAPIVDSGDELRSKTVKAVRVTGKLTNAASEIYGYDVSDVISVSDLEQGLNSDTDQLPITNTTGVAQTPREQVNVPNAVLHTVRVLGDDTGETTRDRIDEIVTEQSDIGVRR